MMAESAMESVRVVKSATCGRSLVFTSKFARGQCILEELPYVYTLCADKTGLFCNFCLKESLTLKKCTRCNCVSYCNKSCQKGDWARCHNQDCKTLMRIPSYLAQKPQLLAQIIRKQRKSVPCTQDGEDCFPTTVAQLESHHEKLSDTSRKEFEKLLFWLKYCGEDVLPEPGSLLKMFGAYLCNTFSICENALGGIAEGIYLRASMVNHSCDHNCLVMFDGRKLQIRTMKDVKEGEECTISYVNVIIPAKERLADLEKTYHFTCKCVKCVEEMNTLGPDDGLEEELQCLRKSLEQIQDAEKSQDWAKVLKTCEPYLKPMDSSNSLPATHHLLVKLRERAIKACINSQAWEKGVEMGQLNIDSYRYHYGPYDPNLGIYLLGQGHVLLQMGRLQEARKYLTEAKSVLEITHGPQHSFMMTPYVQKLLDL